MINRFRIEEKKPYAKKIITIFSNEFEEGINEAVKENCDGIFIRKPVLASVPGFLDLTSLKKMKSLCVHLSFEGGFAKDYNAESIGEMKSVKQLWLPKSFKEFNICANKNIEQLTLSFPSEFINLQCLKSLRFLYLREI
ncbi:hypothetical protein [Chryseobacterium gregarium]|uniref:hypothetical protein n=1 Tax=Chryseobacterium gregarium TaxID=456299 RepID=UPI00047F73FF|nr:hypothetical protein [Chryseobacterium gregarium]